MVIVGLPKEIKDHEERIALLPGAVRVLVRAGHRVLVQRGAGSGSGYPDADYQRAGAHIVNTAKSLYEISELVLKVKEPLPAEYPLLREGLLLFCYLHLAANPQLTRALQQKRVRAVGFETLLDRRGHTPLLSPMSEIAGRLSTLLGAQYLRTDSGGKGVLLSPTAQTLPGRVVVVGGGHVGRSAAEVAAGLGAEVEVFDINPKALASWARRHPRIKVRPSRSKGLQAAMARADLVVGAVYVPGAKTPQVIRRAMVRAMCKGSVLVDVAVDQGGASQTTRPTSITKPTYTQFGVIHSAIPNLPALVSRSASQALSKVLLPYVKAMAALKDVHKILTSPRFRGGANVWDGAIVHPKVKELWDKS